MSTARPGLKTTIVLIKILSLPPENLREVSFLENFAVGLTLPSCCVHRFRSKGPQFRNLG